MVTLLSVTMDNEHSDASFAFMEELDRQCD